MSLYMNMSYGGIWEGNTRLKFSLKKYQEYLEARKEGNVETMAHRFELLQNMGIIILPNILEKMVGGDESLLPMFVYLSDCNELKSVDDCRRWWEKHKTEYKAILDY